MGGRQGTRRERRIAARAATGPRRHARPARFSGSARSARRPMDKPELAVGLSAGPAAGRLLSPGRRRLRAASWRPSPGASAPIASAATRSGDGEDGAQLQGCPRGADHDAGARHRRRRLARPRPHQHARERPGPAGAGGRRAPAWPSGTAPSVVEHRRRRPAGEEFSHDPCRGPRQHARRRG